MFCPTQLVMSVQGTFVLIDHVDATDPQEVEHVPKNLVNEVRNGTTPVRTYDIVTPCTIEAWRPAFGNDSPNRGLDRPIRCVMTTHGYILPYPKGLRFAVWFTGGTLQVDDSKNEKWFRIFNKDTAPKRNLIETGKFVVAKLLVGASTDNNVMDVDGRLSYTLSRPMAGHIDLVYLDPRMQVFRGSSGTVYVHVRIPGKNSVRDCTRSDRMLPSPMDPCQVDDDDDDSDSGTEDGGRDDMDPNARFRQRSQRYDKLIKPVAVPVLPVPTAGGSCLRRIVSESNLENLVLRGGEMCFAGSCTTPATTTTTTATTVHNKKGSSTDRRMPATRSCLKRTTSYEPPSRAWYLDSKK